MQISDEMIRTALGKRLKAIRKEHGMTSERLSELCEVNPVHIRKIEGGTGLPSLPMFVRLCNALNVAPRFFLTDVLAWDADGEIAALGERLRELTPHQYSVVMDITNTLIDKLPR
jgi:transcriptional regulator with XRE-family HTH domain